MNWLQKIALPIRVTPEMDDFAEKILNILFEGDITYDDAFYEDNLMFDDKYVPIAIMMKKPDPSQGLASVVTPTWFDPKGDNSNWSLSASYINIYDTIPPRNSRRELKKAIIHELIHSVDTKLNDPQLFDTDWHQRHREDLNSPRYIDSPTHYTSPWEQDAFMSSEAHDQVSMWKRNGVSLERALQELRNHMADNPREREWRKSPELWRRYMQTMARKVQEIY